VCRTPLFPILRDLLMMAVHMWFKNLVVYRLPTDWCWSASQLEDQLWSRQLRDCGALEMFNRGWTSPFTANDDQRLVRTVNQQHLIALGINQKLLPSSIIRQQVAELAKQQEKDQGFPVGRRQMRELKERVTTELRARALVRRKVMHAWIDPVNNLFVVDSASVPRAEELVETLRDTLGSFAVTLLDTERSPQQAMSAWLALDDAPLRFAIDQELEMQTADATKATVRYVRHPLETKDIKAHLSNGKVVMRLGLTWNDRISLVLTDKLQLKRIQFLDVESGDDDATQEDIDPGELFDAEFALMSGELGLLLKDMIQALGEKEQRAAA
jgi:recombination associated protein RdgC